MNNEQETYEDMHEEAVPQRPVPAQNNYATPIAILFGALLIAGALVFNGQMGGGTKGDAVQKQQGDEVPVAQKIANMKSISSDDHIRGNPNADIFIVEYSDYECPFCKHLHPTLQQIMAEYGAEGRVAWVYRHFPLDSLHPGKARTEAVAAECAAELAGNDGFWKYTDLLYEASESNNRTDVDVVLPKIAADMGLDANAFATCLTSGKYDEKIEASVQDAVATGGQGTPWNIVVTKSGTTYPVSGAQPYGSFKAIIDKELGQ